MTSVMRSFLDALVQQPRSAERWECLRSCLGFPDDAALERLCAFLARGARTHSLLATGSRVYGTPNEDSDYDFVFYGSRDELSELWTFADDDGTEPNEYEGHMGGISSAMRFSPVNILACLKPEQFNAWDCGTAALVARKPVTRDEAVREFQERLAKWGC